MTLIDKYNIPGPRYTSYPTVPYWSETPPTENAWKAAVKKTFDASNRTEGISLYIHLPYCESLCTYCGCNTRITVNHAVEGPYIDALLNEWKLYLNLFEERPVIAELHLGGGTPTFFSPGNLARLINGIFEGADRHPNAELGIEGHPKNTTREHLKVLADLGFTRLSLGIQDFDRKVQETVNRIQTYEEVERCTQDARELGYTSINYDLIYGLPHQTLCTVRDTIEQVKQLRPDRIAFYSYAHVPWIKPGQRSFTEKDLPIDSAKRNLYETGKAMFTAAGYRDIGMDHFALPQDALCKAMDNRSMHRNFMGYTPNKTELMVGLGCSSISDSWTGFVQNIKVVEPYMEAVSNGRFPFFRGHMLTAEDLVVRQHILNIMCRFETAWDLPALQHEAVYTALERLEEMEVDGLVTGEPYHLEVTPEGEPFVRNVCMAFDARLWRKKPEGEVFSKVI